MPAVIIFNKLNVITTYESILFMPSFLFQPDPIEGYEFTPIPVDIHLGVIKIPTKEIRGDGAINNTEAIIVGIHSMEVLNRLQTVFAREFQKDGKLKDSDIRPINYTTRQARTRILKYVKRYPSKEFS